MGSVPPKIGGRGGQIILEFSNAFLSTFIPQLEMKNTDRPLDDHPVASPFANQDLQRLLIFMYFIPIAGMLPALWTLYQQRGSHEQQQASRLVVTLTLMWLLGYVLLGTTVQTTESLTLPLLIMSSLLTSGYFLANIWLMIRLWQRRSLYLPGVSPLSDRLP
jgi:hypothetical protein